MADQQGGRMVPVELLLAKFWSVESSVYFSQSDLAICNVHGSNRLLFLWMKWRIAAAYLPDIRVSQTHGTCGIGIKEFFLHGTENLRLNFSGYLYHHSIK